MWFGRFARVSLVLATLALVGCVGEKSDVGDDVEDSAGSGPTSGGAGAPVPPPAPPGSPALGFCDGSGPVFEPPSSSAPSPGDCQPTLFGAAVCSCSDIRLQGYLRAGDPTLARGSVGANGRIVAEGFVDAAGDLTAAGDGSLGFFGYVRTGGDFEAGGDVNIRDQDFVAGYLESGGNVRVDGDLLLLGYAQVGGDFEQPPGRQRPVVMSVDGANVSGPVRIDEPCGCADDELIDLATPTSEAARDNDNGAAIPALSPGALSAVVGWRRVRLPCGRYYVDEISGTGFIDIAVEGRVVLFVGGDVRNTGFLRFSLADGAELDLVIGGQFVGTGANAFGDAQRAGDTRVYVAGDGDLQLAGFGLFAGNLYAPRSDIRGTGAVFVQGSLFGRSIEIPGFLDVGYAPPGGVCEPDPPPPGDPDIPGDPDLPTPE